MKIMFYTSSLSAGGAERVISNLSNYLIKNNEITILINTKKNIAYKLNDRINVIELDEKNIADPISRNMKRIKKTRKYIGLINPDIIISFLPIPSFRILLLKRKINCKVIVSDRNDPKEEYKSLFCKLMMKKLYKKADGFVFQTKEQQSFFDKNIIKKSTIIYNPLKNEFLENCKEHKKENVIINVGRLDKQKNQKILIESFKKIKDKYPDYKLKIFGDGPLKDELQNLIDKLGLTNNVFLCGTTNKIKDKLNKSKIFVLSSNYEGMPNALMEAMSCGLPCISTDCSCGGPRALIVNKENGILVPVNDKDKIVDSICELLSDEESLNNIGRNALKIRERLNPNMVNKKWEEYINGVFKNEEQIDKNYT